MYSFIQDWAPRKALKGLVFRAPFSKGKITSLSLPEIPRGYTCVRARDIPGQSTLHCAGYTLPVLVDSLVRYLGEPVLLFCGPDSEVLAELAAAVRLSFEEDSRLEHNDLSGPYPEGQIISMAQGDTDLAFSLADQIVEGEYHSGRQEHFYPDTQAALAEWDGKLLIVRTAAQDPFGLRSELARLLGLPERRVRVIAVHTGNTLEGKLLPALLVAAQASLLAYFAKKTVQLVYSREEDLRFTPKSPEFLIRHRTALDGDGAPLAARIQIHMDGGPYPQTNTQGLSRAVQAAWGAYRLSNIEVTARSLVTDHTPVGNFRALGSAQAFFAAELHSSRLEEIAQLDPVRWKRANLAATEAGGRNNRDSALAAPAAVLEAVVSMSDFSRKHAAYSALKKRRKTIQQTAQPLRGIGLSLGYQGPEEALQSGWDERSSFALKVVLERGKRLRIFGSLADGGLGIHELLVTRAAAILGLDAVKVVIEPVDTGSVVDSGPATLGWVAAVGLPLLEQCCHSIRKKREGASPPIEVRRSISIRERSSQKRSERAWASTVVEVELDPVTLRSSCRGIWMAVEAGGSWCEKSILPVLQGECLRALGYACLRGFPQGSGGKPCTSLDLVPGTGELPPVQVHLLPGGEAALKGFEHLPYLGVPPAYCAAVSQATGLYIDKVPATPEVIQQCLST